MANVGVVSGPRGLRMALRNGPTEAEFVWGAEKIDQMRNAWSTERSSRQDVAMLTHGLIGVATRSANELRTAVINTTNKFWDVLNGLVRQRDYLHGSWLSAELDVVRYRNRTWKAEYMWSLYRRHAKCAKKRYREAKREITSLKKDLEKNKCSLENMKVRLGKATREIAQLREEVAMAKAEASCATSRAAAVHGLAESEGLKIDWNFLKEENQRAARADITTYIWEEKTVDSDFA